jgi:hypothetical protein
MISGRFMLLKERYGADSMFKLNQRKLNYPRAGSKKGERSN